MSEPVRVALALGSNLGSRLEHLDYAIRRLGEVVNSLQVSSIIETDPVDVPDEQPPFLNAAAIGATELSPDDLLAALLAIERARGRERPSFRAPRTLDLDLILYGDLIVASPTLVVPHPEFRKREFVLEPLAEIAADWVDPVTGKTVGELLGNLRQ